MSTVRVEESVEIARAVGDVFTYVTDAANFPEWAGVVVDVSTDVSGPLKVGDTFTLAQKFLGRRFESRCETTASEPDQRFAYRTTGGPFPFTFDHTFEPSTLGTRLTVTAEGEPGTFFGLVGPLFEKAGRRQVRNDLETLKDIMESKG